MSVCILNYGSGNVRSVYNAFKQISDCTISNDVHQLRNASHIVLPGVGSYKDSMTRINTNLPVNDLLDELEKGKPFLGICVGMQVLSTKGIEFVEAEGLGIIPGIVSKINSKSLPLPHVGWNNLTDMKSSKLTVGLDPQDDYYFTHSFCFNDVAESYVVAKTEYGACFPSIVSKDNIYGVQFHPEKSQKAGIKILRNFMELK